MAEDGLLITGVILLILGVILSFISYLCFVGIPLAVAGFILLIVGAVQERPRPAMYGYPPAYGGYPPYPTVQPPMMGGIATFHCPRCGQPVTYVPQYQRWYCPAENVYPWG